MLSVLLLAGLSLALVAIAVWVGFTFVNALPGAADPDKETPPPRWTPECKPGNACAGCGRRIEDHDTVVLDTRTGNMLHGPCFAKARRTTLRGTDTLAGGRVD